MVFPRHQPRPASRTKALLRHHGRAFLMHHELTPLLRRNGLEPFLIHHQLWRLPGETPKSPRRHALAPCLFGGSAVLRDLFHDHLNDEDSLLGRRRDNGELRMLVLIGFLCWRVCVCVCVCVCVRNMSEIRVCGRRTYSRLCVCTHRHRHKYIYAYTHTHTHTRVDLLAVEVLAFKIAFRRALRRFVLRIGQIHQLFLIFLG